MTRARLAKKLCLSPADLEEIRTAVRAAEGGTTGEIALAAIGESADYSFFELFAAVMIGVLVFAITLPFHGAIEAVMARCFWVDAPWHATAFAGIVSFAAIPIAFALANIPAIDRLVIPRATRANRVTARSFRHFVESGAYTTVDRTGILIFVSLLEREVRFVADAGINAKIPQETWDALAAALASGIRAGTAKDAFVAAVNACGTILSRHFPAKKENPNELPDGLVLLEGDE